MVKNTNKQTCIKWQSFGKRTKWSSYGLVYKVYKQANMYKMKCFGKRKQWSSYGKAYKQANIKKEFL